jgi:GNAT superfamily N-acetyltransferase
MGETAGPPRVERATVDSVALLVDLTDEFHGEAGYRLDRRSAAAAFATILADPGLGMVWIAYDGGEPAGHAVLTYRFGMEHFGLEGWVDDLFVRPAHRRRGHAGRLLAAVREECLSRRARTMHVVVSRANEPAISLYRESGFMEPLDDRTILTAALPPSAPPAAGGE